MEIRTSTVSFHLSGCVVSVIVIIFWNRHRPPSTVHRRSDIDRAGTSTRCPRTTVRLLFTQANLPSNAPLPPQTYTTEASMRTYLLLALLLFCTTLRVTAFTSSSWQGETSDGRAMSRIHELTLTHPFFTFAPSPPRQSAALGRHLP